MLEVERWCGIRRVLQGCSMGFFAPLIDIGKLSFRPMPLEQDTKLPPLLVIACTGPLISWKPLHQRQHLSSDLSKR